VRRTYSEVVKLGTLRERFDYLALNGEVGCATFGSARWKNQSFYRSTEWRRLRHQIIYRDGGCDLGVPGFDIHHRPVVHHINPITEDDVINRRYCLVDPENLILTTHDTHNAIHYGDARLLPQPPVERRPGDTKEW
jgi:hypothetical protein